MPKFVKCFSWLRCAPVGFFLCSLLWLTGCVSPNGDPRAEFVRSVNFTNYDVFYLEPVQSRSLGSRQRALDALDTTTLSALEAAFLERGFDQASSLDEGHFLVRPLWTLQDLSLNTPDLRMPGPSELGIAEDLRGQQRRDLAYALTVEVRDARSNQVFWRSRPDPRTQMRSLSPAAIESAVAAAMRNFPERIVTDPDLPTLQ